MKYNVGQKVRLTEAAKIGFGLKHPNYTIIHIGDYEDGAGHYMIGTTDFGSFMLYEREVAGLAIVNEPGEPG